MLGGLFCCLWCSLVDDFCVFFGLRNIGIVGLWFDSVKLGVVGINMKFFVFKVVGVCWFIVSMYLFFSIV